ncbi:F-box/LRR-repeat protein 25-like protein [Tanacetum coccineum]
MHMFMAEGGGKGRPNKITPKRMEFEDEEDRISSLPDCLLIEIISRLGFTKEAIKTSTLSKRWQHLWTQVPNLIFHRKYTHSTTTFISIVDKTLTQCSRQSTLTRFVLKDGYDIHFESQLNSCIRYAIHRNVQEIDLSFGAMTEAPFLRLDITSKSVKNLVFSGYFDRESYHRKDVIDIEINANVGDKEAFILSRLEAKVWNPLKLRARSFVEPILDHFKFIDIPSGSLSNTHVRLDRVC